MSEPPRAPTRYRSDGWPCCPRCDHDDLWSPVVPVDAGAELRCYACGWHGHVEPEPTAHLVARLRAALSAMTAVGQWRPGANDKDAIFIPDPNSLGGAGGERVLLRMNRHFPFGADARGIAELVNAMPAVLRRLEEMALELADRHATAAAGGR